jgi:hypothetical protein
MIFVPEYSVVALFSSKTVEKTLIFKLNKFYA